MNTSINSAHSYTEGSDINPIGYIPTIEDQIKFIDLMANDFQSKRPLFLAIKENLIAVRNFNKANEPKGPAHYAPLRAGKDSGTIVTDTCTHQHENQLDIDKEVGYYGGFLAAESIPNERLRDQLVDAYNDYFLIKASGVSKATAKMAAKQRMI